MYKSLKTGGRVFVSVPQYMFTLFPLMLVSRLFGKKDEAMEVMTDALYPGKVLNTIFNICARIDVILIKLGVSLPWGRNLMEVGRKQI
jgi:hypothetical protein